MSLQSPTHKALHFVDLTNVVLFLETVLFWPFYQEINSEKSSSDLFIFSRHH